MAHVTNYSLEIGRAGLNWALGRLPVYLIAMAVGVVGFFAAITAYVVVVPKPALLPAIPIQEIIAPLPSVAPPVSPLAPGDVVAGWPSSAGFALSKILGTEIYGSDNKKIGKLSELVLANNGQAEAVVIALDGYWMNAKHVVVPYKSVRWVAGPTSATVAMDGPGRGVVPYTKLELQRVPAYQGHPMIVPRKN